MSIQKYDCDLGITVLNSAMPRRAISVPTTAANAASIADSTSDCLTTAIRVAPSAVRMPISRVRPTARSSSRFATFAQATSSTSMTATSIV